MHQPSINHIEQKYQHDQMPPDWDLAEKHARSVRPGKHIPDKNEACPCCLNIIEKQPVSFSEDNKELAFMGEGFPLFYNFLKFCMIMLFAIMMDSSIIGIYFGTTENQCTEYSPDESTTTHRLLTQTHCSYSIATKYAYIDSTHQPDYRRIMNIISFIVQLIILLYFREKQNKLASYIDERNCTMSDYTIYIQKIPKEAGVKEKLKKMINLKQGQEDVIKVQDLLAVSDCEEYYTLEKQLKQIVQDKKNAIKKNQDEEIIKNLDTLYSEKERNLMQLSKIMQHRQEQYFTGCAFVILKTEEQKNKAIQRIRTMTTQEIKQCFPTYSPEVNGKIEVSEAHEPKEIIWENIHYSFRQRTVALLGGWVVTIVILAVVTIGFFFLIRYKSLLVEEAMHKYSLDPELYKKEWEEGTALAYIIIILINLFNKFVISWIAHAITDKEKHVFASNYQQSFALKYMLCMFFTTALMTLAVEAVVFNNYAHSFGVVEEETFMFVFNAFFPPLMMFFDPSYLIHLIKKSMNVGALHYTQEEANHIMEIPHYNMGKRYAEILKTMWFTFLYVELIPFGPVFSLAGIIVYYCIDKYILLRRSTVTNTISCELSKRMISVLQFTLVLKPAGQLLFDAQIRSETTVETWCMLGIGILYMLIPWDGIIDYFFGENFEPEDQEFEEGKFHQSYKTLYPPNKYHDGTLFKGSTISFATQKSKNLISNKDLNETMNKIHPEGQKDKGMAILRDDVSIASPSKKVLTIEESTLDGQLNNTGIKKTDSKQILKK